MCWWIAYFVMKFTIQIKPALSELYSIAFFSKLKEKESKIEVALRLNKPNPVFMNQKLVTRFFDHAFLSIPWSIPELMIG